MRRQLSLKSLLWLMAVVVAFFAGAEWQHRTDVECLEYKAWVSAHKSGAVNHGELTYGRQATLSGTNEK
jgi:hypothetical protein